MVLILESCQMAQEHPRDSVFGCRVVFLLYGFTYRSMRKVILVSCTLILIKRYVKNLSVGVVK